jgi:hypothetical protein
MTLEVENLIMLRFASRWNKFGVQILGDIVTMPNLGKLILEISALISARNDRYFVYLLVNEPVVL